MKLLLILAMAMVHIPVGVPEPDLETAAWAVESVGTCEKLGYIVNRQSILAYVEHSIASAAKQPYTDRQSAEQRMEHNLKMEKLRLEVLHAEAVRLGASVDQIRQKWWEPRCQTAASMFGWTRSPGGLRVSQ
jgi:hypothetical protein